MRSALVNNNLFASLAVKWNFHKYMKSLSAPQFKVIDLYISNKYTDPDIVKETVSIVQVIYQVKLYLISPLKHFFTTKF